MPDAGASRKRQIRRRTIREPFWGFPTTAACMSRSTRLSVRGVGQHRPSFRMEMRYTAEEDWFSIRPLNWMVGDHYPRRRHFLCLLMSAQRRQDVHDWVEPAGSDRGSRAERATPVARSIRPRVDTEAGKTAA